MDYFSNTMQCHAICTYLKGYGYKAQVDNNTLCTYVQDPVENSFIVLPIPTWEVAREFIRIRTKD